MQLLPPKNQSFQDKKNLAKKTVIRVVHALEYLVPLAGVVCHLTFHCNNVEDAEADVLVLDDALVGDDGEGEGLKAYGVALGEVGPGERIGLDRG
jgi:hypothetical protein